MFFWSRNTFAGSARSTSLIKMMQAPIRNLFGLITATVCLMWMPAQAAHQNNAANSAQAPNAGDIFRDCPSCPEMVVIPSGSFDMGSPGSEVGRSKDEGPVHRVNVATFAMGKTEITRGQFAAFVAETGYSAGDKCSTLEKGKFEARNGDWLKLRYGQEDNHPIGCINWTDANVYAGWLSQKTGQQYRLPTEAEWEYTRTHARTSCARLPLKFLRPSENGNIGNTALITPPKAAPVNGIATIK